jgi:hypothetical protein
MARPSKATAFLNGVRKRKGGAVRVEVDGLPVHLRPLATKELVEFRKWHAENKDKDGANLEFAGKLIAASVVDPEAGEPILSADDIGELDPAFMNALIGEIETLNGFTESPKA